MNVLAMTSRNVLEWTETNTGQTGATCDPDPYDISYYILFYLRNFVLQLGDFFFFFFLRLARFWDRPVLIFQGRHRLYSECLQYKTSISSAHL
jgi:hypothetical protein